MLLIHSVLRWVVVILGLITVVKFLVGWLQKSQFGPLDARLARWFTIALDSQVLVGIILLVWSGIATGAWPRQRFEHAFLMIVAVVVAHLSARWRTADDTTRFRNTFIAFAVSLVLVGVGVALLAGGWGRPFPPPFTLP